MNGRHVLVPQGARAIQNPAYRPAGSFVPRREILLRSAGCALGRACRFKSFQLFASKSAIGQRLNLVRLNRTICRMASGAYPWGKSTNAASRCRRNWRKRGRCRCRRRICFGERGDPRGAAAVEGPSRSLSAIRLRNCASWCRKGSTAGRDDLHRWMKSRPRHGDACDLTTRHEFSAYRSERTS